MMLSLEEALATGQHAVYLTVLFDNGATADYGPVENWEYREAHEHCNHPSMLVVRIRNIEENLTSRFEVPLMNILHVGVQITNPPPRESDADLG